MKTIKVFLSSSTDGLEEEREVFASVINDIERIYKQKGIEIVPYRWEKGRSFVSYPNFTIQEVINKDVEDSSIFVFIFYNKLGEGVRTEFEKAQVNGKPMFIYVKECSYTFKDELEDPVKYKRYTDLGEFLKKLDKNVYIKNFYKTPAEFVQLLRGHIDAEIKKYCGGDISVPLYSSKINIDTPIPTNNLFVGRLDEMEELDNRLKKYEAVAIYGMGGMGKTSLTAHYCREHLSDYDKIIWVPYHDNLQDSILSLGANYSYQNDGKQLGFGEIVSSLNSIEGKKLIVFDNFDIDRDEINEKYNEIKQCFPTFKKVFTTRTNLSVLNYEICVYNLIELKKEEAVVLFKEYYRNDLDDTQVSFSELSLFLDVVCSHTLIIELVAKTLNNHFSITMREIIGYVRHENKLEPIRPGKSFWVDSKTWGHGEIAITDISTKLYNMDLLSDEERRLLEILAILCEEGIDARFLMRVIAPDRRRKFEDLVNRLSTNGWINKTGFNVKCHRILADIVLNNPIFDIDGINTILNNLATMTSYNALDDVAARKPYYQMQRLLLTYLKNNKVKADVSSKSVADNAINFYYNGATLDVDINSNTSQKSSELEEKLSYQFLVYAKSQCEEDQLEICHINECLARTFIDYYRYDDALNVLNEAKQIEDIVQNGDSLDKAKTYYELAYLLYNYKDRGSMAFSIEYLNQSYRIYSNLLNENCIENLKNCLLYISVFDGLDAEEDVNKWVKKAQFIIDKSNVDEYNPLFIQYYKNMSNIDKGKQMFYIEKAEDLIRRLYGDNHPELGQIALLKFLCSIQQGNYDDSNEYLEMWIQNDILNFGHTRETDYYSDIYKLMILFCSNYDDKWSRFIDYFNNSVCSKICNEDSNIFRGTEMRSCFLWMGIALFKTDQYELALSYLQKAYDILSEELFNYDFGRIQELLNSVSKTTSKSSMFSSKLLGGNDLVDIVDYMVKCHISLGRLEEATNLIDLITTKDHVKDLYSQKRCTILRGEIELRSKHREKAMRLFNESLKDLQETELKELTIVICEIYANAAIYFKEFDFEEAKSCFMSGISLLKEQNDIESQKFLIIVLREFAHLYMENGKYGEARIHFAERIDIMKHLGESVSHHDIADAYDDLGVCLSLQDRTADAELVLKQALENIVIKENTCEDNQLAATIHNHLAQVYQSLDEFQKAENHYQDCLCLLESVDEVNNKAKTDCLMKLSIVLSLQEKYDDCIKVTEMALSLTEENDTRLLLPIHSNLAYLYKEKGEFDKAEEHYREQIAIMEKQGVDVSLHDLADAYDDLGVYLFQLDRNSEAIELLDHALVIIGELGDEDLLIATIHDHLAQVFRAGEEYEKAECHYKANFEHLENVKGVSGDTLADILINVGMMLARQDKYDECLVVIERALSLASDENVHLMQAFHSNLAYLYKEKGEFDKAEEHYREQIAIMEKQGVDVSLHDLADAYDDFGVCLFQLDRRGEAIELLEHALDIIGELGDEDLLIATIHNHLAQVFRAGEEYEKAECHYKANFEHLENVKGVSGDTLADILINVGMMLARQDKYDECLVVIERALSLASDENVHLMQAIHSNLAYLYKEKGEFDKAVGHYREQIAIIEKQDEEASPHNLADAYDDLGVLLFQVDRNSEAIESLEHALQIIGDKEDEISLIAAIHNHLAKIYQDCDDSVNAELHKMEFDRLKKKIDNIRENGQEETSA